MYRAVSAVEEGLNAAPPVSLGFSPRRPRSPSPTPLSPQKHTISSAAKSKRPQDRQYHHDDSSQSLSGEGNEDYDQARIEIENGVHQLETLLEKHVDRNFDRLEIYLLRNSLAVPQGLEDWVQLGHYEHLDFPRRAPPGDGAQSGEMQTPPSPQTLVALRRKLHETQKLHAALSVESERNQRLISQLRGLLVPQASTNDNSFSSAEPSAANRPNISFLANSRALGSLRSSAQQQLKGAKGQIVPEVTSKPILTTAQSLMTKDLPTLRSLLNNLREAQASGVLSKAPALTAKDVERNEYLEGAVRDAVGRVRDADGQRAGFPAVQGAREGLSGSGSGREEEVSAIERIARALSGKRRDEDGDTRMEDG